MPDALRREIERLMSLYPDRHSATLPALGAAQRVHGWCSPEALRQVAAVMQVTPAYLSSVATFYDMLRTEPSGSRYVYVCTSVACHVRNAKQIYEAIAEQAEAQGLEDVELREFECLGACDMAPMASVDGRYVGPAVHRRRVRVRPPGEGRRDGAARPRPARIPGFSVPVPAPQPDEPPEHPVRARGGRRVAGRRAGRAAGGGPAAAPASRSSSRSPPARATRARRSTPHASLRRRRSEE